jgi:RNase P subunit RPR2
VGRRGIKEYRAPEALVLIAADRDQKPLVCPSCNAATIDRVPVRSDDDVAAGGKITLHCASCGRTAVYIARTLSRASLPEAPRPHHT